MTRFAPLFALAAFFAGSPALAGDTVTVNLPGGATQVISSIGISAYFFDTSTATQGWRLVTLSSSPGAPTPIYGFPGFGESRVFRTPGGTRVSTQSEFIGNILLPFVSSRILD